MKLSTQAEIILYVRDQQVSAAFYTHLLQQEAVLDVPGMTAFDLLPNLRLGLMPQQGIARIIVPHLPHPEQAQGIPRCEIYLYVEDVAYCYDHALSIGARAIAAPEARDWGHLVAYVADPDGHVIAFAREN